MPVPKACSSPIGEDSGTEKLGEGLHEGIPKTPENEFQSKPHPFIQTAGPGASSSGAPPAAQSKRLSKPRLRPDVPSKKSEDLFD